MCILILISPLSSVVHIYNNMDNILTSARCIYNDNFEQHTLHALFPLCFTSSLYDSICRQSIPFISKFKRIKISENYNLIHNFADPFDSTITPSVFSLGQLDVI